MLLAMDLQMLLEEHGCEVLDPVPSVERALDALAAHRLDAATLDMNLNGKTSAPIADALRQRAVPFIVVSGYGGKHPDPAFRDAPLVKKPFDSIDLLRKLSTILR